MALNLVFYAYLPAEFTALVSIDHVTPGEIENYSHKVSKHRSWNYHRYSLGVIKSIRGYYICRSLQISTPRKGQLHYTESQLRNIKFIKNK